MIIAVFRKTEQAIYTFLNAGKEKGESLERYAWKVTVKEGMLEEYIRRHDNIWPEMTEMLTQAGIRDDTIWNVENELFDYYECDSVEVASRARSDSEINAKWDGYMKDVMGMERDPVTGAQPLLKQVFLFE